MDAAALEDEVLTPVPTHRSHRDAPLKTVEVDINDDEAEVLACLSGTTPIRPPHEVPQNNSRGRTTVSSQLEQRQASLASFAVPSTSSASVVSQFDEESPSEVVEATWLNSLRERHIPQRIATSSIAVGTPLPVPATRAVAATERLHAAGRDKERRRAQEMLEYQRRKEQDEIAACTFSPMVNRRRGETPSRAEVHERLFAESAAQRLHLASQAIEEEERRMLDCSFSPRISLRAELQCRGAHVKSCQEWEKAKREKLESLRILKEREERAQLKDPVITAKSKFIVATRCESSPTFDRLYRSAGDLRERQEAREKAAHTTAVKNSDIRQHAEKYRADANASVACKAASVSSSLSPQRRTASPAQRHVFSRLFDDSQQKQHDKAWRALVSTPRRSQEFATPSRAAVSARGAADGTSAPEHITDHLYRDFIGRCVKKERQFLAEHQQQHADQRLRLSPARRQRQISEADAEGVIEVVCYNL